MIIHYIKTFITNIARDNSDFVGKTYRVTSQRLSETIEDWRASINATKDKRTLLLTNYAILSKNLLKVLYKKR